MSWTDWGKRFRRERASETDRRDLTFRQWLSKFHPRFRLYRLHSELVDVADRIASGEIKRAMFFIPPRHGKSETMSRLFTAYLLWRFPDKFVGLSSYSAELAYSLSRASRENYRVTGGEMDPAARAIRHWQTVERGGLWACGVGGPATGKGYHFGDIDDPLKNAKEAQSAIIREGQKEWYQSVWLTRMEPDAALWLIMTRWNPEDLGGWLLSVEMAEAAAVEAGEEDAQPENWYIVYLPAICEKPEDRPEFPSTCTVHPDWREPGEPLCPERYPLARLKKLMKQLGAYFWSALFQQTPTPKDGLFFHTAEIEFVEALPASAKPKQSRAWDIGATEDGDPTASARMAGPCKDGYFYILHGEEVQLNTAKRDKHIRQVAVSDGQMVRQRLPQDPGAAGKSQAEAFIKLLKGFAVRCRPVSKKKELRADPFSSQVNAGNVKIVVPGISQARYGLPAWVRLILERLRTFPLHPRDDLVDALSDAFDELQRPGAGQPAAGGKESEIVERLRQ